MVDSVQKPAMRQMNYSIPDGYYETVEHAVATAKREYGLKSKGAAVLAIVRWVTAMAADPEHSNRIERIKTKNRDISPDMEVRGLVTSAEFFNSFPLHPLPLVVEGETIH